MAKKPTNAQIARAAIDRFGFAEFCRQAWPLVEPGTPFLWNWHHAAICEALEAVARKKVLNLIINVPPGCTKTTIVTKMWPAYVWTLDASERILAASYDPSLMRAAAGHTRGSLKILKSKWFRAVFPEVRILGGESVPESDYSTTKLGFRFSTSIGGKVTGRHGTIKIVDDPQKPASTSKVALDNVWEWYRGTWTSRESQADCRSVIIMQRLGAEDLVGHLLEEEPGEWVHLRIPMEYDPEAPPLPDCCRTKDPRTVRGELLWPQRFPPAKVAKLKRSLGPLNASAQLQQDPTPGEGVLFNRAWFPRWDWRSLPVVMDRVMLSCDAAFKGAESNDRVAVGIWGQRGGKLFLLHAEAQHRTFLETLAALTRLISCWHPDAILVEGKANGSAICDTLRQRFPGVVEVDPGADSKIARAQSVTGYAEAGDILVPHEDLASWVSPFLKELSDFPRGRWDDQVDQFAQVARYALGSDAGYSQNIGEEAAAILEYVQRQASGSLFG